MKLRHFLLPIVAAFLVSIVVAWFWLLHTESGARWIWGVAQNSVAGSLGARSIDGDLSSGASLRGVTFATGTVSASVESIDLAIDLDILPLSLEVTTLHIDSSRIALSPGVNSDDADPVDVRDVLAGLALPIGVEILDLQISNTTLLGLIADRPVEIIELQLVGDWNDELQIERVHMAAEDGIIDAVASVELYRPFNLDLTSQIHLLPAATGLPDLVDADVSAAGNLDLVTVAIDSRSIEGHLRGTISNLLELPAWDVTINVPAYEQSLGTERNLRVENLALASEGTIDGYSVDAALAVDATGIEPLSVRLTGVGTLESIELSSLLIDGTDISMSARSSMRWAEPRRVDANVQVDRVRPTGLLADWPAAAQVSGTLSLLLTDNHLLIENAALKLIGTETEVELDANVDLTSNVVDGDLSWKHVQWPIAASTPRFTSEQGSILLGGTPDRWKVSGRAAIQAVDVAGGQFVVTGGGDRDGLALQIEESQLLGGGVRGQVEYSWVNNMRLAGDLTLAKISIGSLLPDWPGVVSGDIAIDGQLHPLRLQAVLKQVQGNLRGERLLANGAVIFGDGELAASELRIEHGQSRASLDGSLYAATGLGYSLQLDNLGDYLNGYYGSFGGSGRVSLDPDKPYLRIDASSDEIGYRDYRMRGVRISDGKSDGPLIDTEIRIGELSVGYQDLTDVELRASFAREEQVLTLAATARGVQFDVGLRGSFADWTRMNESPWTGALDVLRINVEGEGEISLTQSAALLLSRRSASVDRLCIGHASDTHFCSEVAWESTGAVDAHIELMDIPAELLNMFTNTGLAFDQLVDGTINWTKAPKVGATGSANIRLTPGTLREVGGSGITINTGPGILAFDIREGELFGGVIELPMPGTGNLSGSFSVRDVTQGEQSEVDGSLSIAMNDLSIAATLLPLIDDTGGGLTAMFSLQGTVADPVLTGEFAVTDGKLAYLPLGLKLDDLQIGGKLLADDSIEVEGHFQAGKGRAEISSRAVRETATTGLELSLRGENLTIIDVPDLRATADTDLRVNIDGKRLTLGGSVLVDHASVRPRNLTVNRVTESSDVVIVAGVLPGEDETAAKTGNLEIVGELDVSLGEDFIIDLDVAKAKLTGESKFVWSGPVLPNANGRYDLTGSVQAYGQVLEISEGIIRFTGGPADNPIIRINAEREIFGNSQIKRAGVLVEGTAKRPSIGAYTFPLTTEERALTLLVTGSDFDYEQGVGAIDFGTYIAPKLFLSYGISLFDQSNIISARYDLVNGFGVKATSGEKSSGVDFIYRIDR